MITFTLEIITPEVASVYLSHNDKQNRKIRRGALSEYVACMKDGSWTITHQAIAFDCNGMLIDGQHRLRAICESNTTQQMYVARYDSAETSMQLSIDRNARRTAYDVLHLEKKETEIASTLLYLANAHCTPTVKSIGDLVGKIQPELQMLRSACNTAVKLRSGAIVKGAVICNMITNQSQKEEIANQYRAFVLLDFDACRPSVKALLKAVDNMTSRSGSDRAMLFARTMKAFCPSNFDQKVNRLGDAAQENRAVRLFILHAIESANENSE